MSGTIAVEQPAMPRRSYLWLILQVVARVLTTILFDLKVWGAEHVPKSGGVLLVANHQSYLDPVLAAVRLRRPVAFFAKSELFENRFFGGFIRALHAFPVRQGKGDKSAIEETVRRLGEGNVLNVYPEGTRTLDGEIQPLQKGVALIVRKANVPIVPCVIDGSFAAWPKSGFPRARPIRVLYGPPINIAGLRGEAIVQKIEQTLRRMHADVRQRSTQFRGHGIAPPHITW